MKPRGLSFALFALAVSTLGLPAQTPPKTADQWLTGSNQFPARISTNQLRAEPFAALHAEALVGQVKIYLPGFASAAGVTLVASAEEAGHWPARDWRSHAMARRGDSWEATVPVDDLDTPLIYFALAGAPGATNLSPMRRCVPRALGLETPSVPFTPFLDGFEETLESWRLADGGGEEFPLRADPSARRGRRALLAQIEPGRRSVTVATTAVRGWRIGRHGCAGLALWLRTRAGAGQARFTLLGHAATVRQAVSPAAVTAALTPQWQKVELPFSVFPRAPLADADLFTIEFTGPPGAEFLVDDFQFITTRKLELE